MSCERMEDQLIPYLEGRSTQAERRDVEAHLAVCGACRTRAEEFRLLWGMLDEMPMQEPSTAFDGRLRERIAAEPRRPRIWAWLAPSPRFAFAISLLLILSVWVSSLPPAPPSPNPPAAITSEAEFRMIKDLPVLENYDVLANFEVLSELPAQSAPENNREM